MTRNVLKRLGLSRVAFVAGVGLPFIIATSAKGQAPAAPPAPAPAQAAPAQAEAERVIVTGSNIPTAEEVGPNPVLNLNRDLINKAGQKTAEQFLRQQSVANANSVNVNNNGTSQAAGPAGTSSVSLRGFDPTATLVLIDGRRVTEFPATGFFDLNTIPLAAIESIEILKDGASATYGADAVAGVVNFKLFKDYRGAQLTLHYGDTLDKDAGEYSGDLLFGTGDDKVSINGDIFFYHHNSTFNIDRGNSLKPPFLSSNAIPWNLQISGAVAAAAGGQNLAALEFATPPNKTNGKAPAGAYFYDATGRPRGPFSDFPGFNFNLQSSSYPEQERWGGYAAFNDKICDDQVQLYGDFFYDDVKTHDELAPGATGSFVTPGQSTIAIPPHSNLNGVAPPHTPRFIGQGTGALSGEVATNTPFTAFNPFNPFNQIISGGTRARLFDFGNRHFDNENEAWLVTLGVKGDKLFDGNWGYDAGFRYSEITSISQTKDTSVSRFNRIMNQNDSIFQPGSPDFIGTTVAFDPFTSKQSIPTNAATINFATLHIHNLIISKLAELNLNIYTTDLFDMPAGPVGLAFGGEWRRENFEFKPDDQARLADEVGVAAAVPSAGGRKDYAFYSEMQIPLFSPEMGIWGLHNVEFTASARYEDFRSNSTNALVPKLALRWQPFDEQLTIRSTWGEGFLEPSLFELFSGPVFILTPTTITGPPGKNGSPVSTHNEPETTTEINANRNLQPERSRTWSGGAVYTPKWIPPALGTITVHADFWDIERRGVVIAPGSQDVVSRSPLDFNANGTPHTNRLKPGEEVTVDPVTGSVNFIRLAFQNNGVENARGVDLGFQWQYQTANWGTFTWLTEATYLDQFIFQSSSGVFAHNVAGRSTSDPWDSVALFGNATIGDGWLKWKGNSSIDWAWRNFDLYWIVHYLDGFHEEIQPFAVTQAKGNEFHDHYVHGTWFFDCLASYTVIFAPPVESAPVAGYSKGGKEVMTSKEGKAIESTAAYSMPCWKTLLNNTTFTVGCNDVFGQDPPPSRGFGAGNANNYPGATYDNLGRFVYGEIKKKF